MILVDAAIMEWWFGSVKEKTRQFGEEASERNEKRKRSRKAVEVGEEERARGGEESGLALQADRENSWRLLNWVLSVVRSVCF
jgi:hypothetical protein